MDAQVKTSLGHLDLPGAKESTFVFISCFDWDPKRQTYRFGAFCQNCLKGSLRNLSKEDVAVWIAGHKEDCAENATKQMFIRSRNCGTGSVGGHLYGVL